MTKPSALFMSIPISRGQGIGKMLIDAAFAHPRFKAAQNIFIDVWDENKRAMSFYLRYGFEIVGKCDVVVDSQVVGQDLVLKRHSTASRMD